MYRHQSSIVAGQHAESQRQADGVDAIALENVSNFGPFPQFILDKINRFGPMETKPDCDDDLRILEDVSGHLKQGHRLIQDVLEWCEQDTLLYRNYETCQHRKAR